MDKEHNAVMVEALRQLLISRKATTQEQLCQALEAQGFEANQSKISRLLRKINAIKVVNIEGHAVYSLPREPAPPNMSTMLNELILEIVHNEALVVIYTSPGSASMVARILDYHQLTTGILGTIAGDDTIFVAPKSTSEVKALAREIKSLLHSMI